MTSRRSWPHGAGRRRRIRPWVTGAGSDTDAARNARSPTGPTVEARGLGIRPDEPTDVSDRLQAALDDLGESGGGTLQLDVGRYVLDRPLFVHHSHVVLRGAGKEATTLFFPRPLAESVAPGHLLVVDRRTGLLHRPRATRGVDGTTDGNARSEGWIAGETLATVAPAHAGRGDARRRQHERARARATWCWSRSPTARTRDTGCCARWAATSKARSRTLGHDATRRRRVALARRGQRGARRRGSCVCSNRSG